MNNDGYRTANQAAVKKFLQRMVCRFPMLNLSFGGDAFKVKYSREERAGFNWEGHRRFCQRRLNESILIPG